MNETFDSRQTRQVSASSAHCNSVVLHRMATWSLGRATLCSKKMGMRYVTIQKDKSVPLLAQTTTWFIRR
jgi:hypothetical protein